MDIRFAIDLVTSLSQVKSMKTVIISEFKAKCIGILKEVNQTGESMTVTLRGQPLAVIKPIKPKSRTLGALRDVTKVHGDIVHTDFDKDWEMSL
ncbi:MAG: type II toxin-antitoxin system Phd/YefM family antitoxin [Verrucomicrobiota bacterium]